MILSIFQSFLKTQNIFDTNKPVETYPIILAREEKHRKWMKMFAQYEHEDL